MTTRDGEAYSEMWNSGRRYKGQYFNLGMQFPFAQLFMLSVIGNRMLGLNLDYVIVVFCYLRVGSYSIICLPFLLNCPETWNTGMVFT